jgi:hypothetical protein
MFTTGVEADSRAASANWNRRPQDAGADRINEIGGLGTGQQGTHGAEIEQIEDNLGTRFRRRRARRAGGEGANMVTARQQLMYGRPACGTGRASYKNGPLVMPFAP